MQTHGFLRHPRRSRVDMLHAWSSIRLRANPDRLLDGPLQPKYGRPLWQATRGDIDYRQDQIFQGPITGDALS